MAIKPKNDETAVVICFVFMAAFVVCCVAALLYLTTHFVRLIIHP